MTQSDALSILKLGHNVFLTGPAGSGKTYVLNHYLEYLRHHGVDVGITASTGIAATHISGTTIHSWCGLGIRDSLTEKDIRDLLKKPYLRAKFKKVRVLVIDEISMLDGIRLDLVNQLCKVFLQNATPFGGLQVILCGDLFQLPPVSRGAASSPIYESRSWHDLGLRICYLEEQHRQEDMTLLDILNEVRSDSVSKESVATLHSRIDAPLGPLYRPTKLYTHNADVDAINAAELEKIPEIVEIYAAVKKTGSDALIDFLKKSCLAPELLSLKKGALVMFVKNNFEEGYVNGTLGTVIDFDERHYPIVRTHGGREIIAQPADWSIEEHGEIKAAISQIPLRLAWAITVHKSQGMSLDAAEIDLSKSFTPGMGYVALSRVRTLSGITLKGINDTALRVDPAITIFDQLLLAQSVNAAKELHDIPSAKLASLQKATIGTRKKTKEEFILF